MKNKWIPIFCLLPLLVALKAGDPVPDFEALNQDGKAIRLSALKGQSVLIFFYPKDDTPGCTKEACEFRDRYSEIKKLNTTVLGVSRQDSESHLKFKQKHRIPFDLLVDQDGKIAKSFGIGSIPILGLTHRQSVLIGKDQKLIKFYESVQPETHAQEVLEDLKKASAP